MKFCPFKLGTPLTLDRDRPKNVRSACRRLSQNVSVPLTRPASLRSSRSAQRRSRARRREHGVNALLACSPRPFPALRAICRYTRVSAAPLAFASPRHRAIRPAPIPCHTAVSITVPEKISAGRTRRPSEPFEMFAFLVGARAAKSRLPNRPPHVTHNSAVVNIWSRPADSGPRARESTNPRRRPTPEPYATVSLDPKISERHFGARNFCVEI